MKEIKYHHWEEERTETALDYQPIQSYAAQLKVWMTNLLKPRIAAFKPHQWRLIDQIMEVKKK